MFNRSRNKYNAVKHEVDGITFDSKKEASWYELLKARQDCGDIKDLKLQTPFQLQPGFKIKINTGTYYSAGAKKGEEKLKEVTFRPIIYIADFCFFDVKRDRFRVLDCKGMRTDLYLMKKKMFNYLYKQHGHFIEESL